MRRLLVVLALCISSAASAAETITYSYDARGRLVKVVRTGPENKTTTYQIDKADNRTNKTVANNPPPP